MVCEGNWSNAEHDPATTQPLIEEAVSAGFAYALFGGVQEARYRWGDKVAMGKVNIAMSASKPPRLVMDSSVPNVNPTASIAERVDNPSLGSLPSDLDGSEGMSDLVAVTIDVKSAHTRIRVLPGEQGMLRFRHSGKTYAYRCCHFGGKFSSYWWARKRLNIASGSP